MSLAVITWCALSGTWPNNYHVIKSWTGAWNWCKGHFTVTKYKGLLFLAGSRKCYGFHPKTKPLVISDLVCYVIAKLTFWLYCMCLTGSYSEPTLKSFGIGANGSRIWLIGLIWDSTHSVFERLRCRKSLRRNREWCVEVRKVGWNMKFVSSQLCGLTFETVVTGSLHHPGARRLWRNLLLMLAFLMEPFLDWCVDSTAGYCILQTDCAFSFLLHISVHSY